MPTTFPGGPRHPHPHFCIWSLGYKMKKRVGAIEEFTFLPLTEGRQLHITIAITGWLASGKYREDGGQKRMQSGWALAELGLLLWARRCLGFWPVYVCRAGVGEPHFYACQLLGSTGWHLSVPPQCTPPSPPRPMPESSLTGSWPNQQG